MRRLFIFLSITTFVAIGCEKSDPTATSEPPSAASATLGASSASAKQASKVETATFGLEGMTCASCNLTVKIAAEKVNGVQEAKANFDTKQAIVSYDPSKTNSAAIAAAITKAGYPATPVESVN